MKTSQCVLLLVAGLIIGFCAGGNVTGPTANAQGIPNAVASSSPRFQIAVWAYPGNPSRPDAKHGCYISDTVTGELWYANLDGKPVKISEKLR